MIPTDANKTAKPRGSCHAGESGQYKHFRNLLFVVTSADTLSAL